MQGLNNPPSNAGNTSLIPGLGTKIPHATEKINSRAAAAETAHSGACAPQLGSTHCNKRSHMTQLRLGTAKQIANFLNFLNFFFKEDHVDTWAYELNINALLRHYPPQPCEVDTNFPFYRWGNWGSKDWRDLPKVIGFEPGQHVPKTIPFLP